MSGATVHGRGSAAPSNRARPWWCRDAGRTAARADAPRFQRRRQLISAGRLLDPSLDFAQCLQEFGIADSEALPQRHPLGNAAQTHLRVEIPLADGSRESVAMVAFDQACIRSRAAIPPAQVSRSRSMTKRFRSTETWGNSSLKAGRCSQWIVARYPSSSPDRAST